LFMTHCLRLNLQLHTISLVRTCRISSFCTVAWQLARLLLTIRIARSLGDSWASCYTDLSPCIRYWVANSAKIVVSLKHIVHSPLFSVHRSNAPETLHIITALLCRWHHCCYDEMDKFSVSSVTAIHIVLLGSQCDVSEWWHWQA